MFKILEESPCKRWSKRREQVKQRDVPGIDFAYLAMDNETGNEVVWNEVLFSERKNFRAQEVHFLKIFCCDEFRFAFQIISLAFDYSSSY